MEASASASASSGGRSPRRTSRASTSFARNESASAGYLSRTGTLLKSGGERIQRAAVGSASTIYNVLLSVSRGFGSVRDSLRRRAPETDPFLKALEFRTRVHDEIGAMDAVDHAVLLNGSQFPKLNTATLQKFLIARKYDVDKAFEMLMNYVEWRLTHISIAESEIVQSLAQEKVYVVKKTDKLKHICICIVVRKHIMKEVSLEETTKLIVYVIDKVTSTFLKKKRAMDKLTCIIDLQDISMANLDGAALKTILTLLQNYFPETLALMVLWRPPSIFFWIWKMIVPFVDPKTKGKILMAYKKKDLEKHFEEKNLPGSIGGTGSEDLFVRIQDLQSADVDGY